MDIKMIYIIFISLFILTFSVDLDEISRHIHSNCSDLVNIVNQPSWEQNFESYYNAFLENKFVNYVGTNPIFVYGLKFQSFLQFGNRIGAYFEIISICKRAHIHFIAFYCPSDHTHGEHKSFMENDLIKSLDMTIEDSNPVKSREEALKNLKDIYYKNHAWGWSDRRASMYLNLEQIAVISYKISIAMQNHDLPYKMSNRTELNITSFEVVSSRNTSNSIDSLPFIPDAAILFRCVDLLNAGHYNGYGVMNFNVYPLIIPRETQHIYVLTEALTYSPNSPHSVPLCINISNGLINFLQDKYPESIITLRRGYAIDSFVQLTRTKLVICNPSTFCLFSGISNTFLKNGEVYMSDAGFKQVRSLYFPDNWNWMSYPKFYPWFVKLVIR